MCALCAFLAALAVVSSLRWVLPIHEGVYRSMQFHRSCSWIAASRWIDPVVRAGLALLVGLALLRTGRRDPRNVSRLVLVFVGGLAIVELLSVCGRTRCPGRFGEQLPQWAYDGGSDGGGPLCRRRFAPSADSGNTTSSRRPEHFTAVTTACVSRSSPKPI
jgi:hypothetical protein